MTKPTKKAIAAAAAAFGRIGGNARAGSQTPAQRSALARRAAKARWAKHRKATP